jgi:uncharacterized protein YkwD
MKKLFLVFSIFIGNISISQSNTTEVTYQQHVDAKTKSTSIFDYKAYESSVIARINEYRIQNGLSALVFDSALYLAADYQAAYMSQTGDVTHYNETPGMITPSNRVNFFMKSSRKTVAECSTRPSLYINFIKNIPHDQSIFDLWKTSKPHNNILLRTDITMIAVSISRNGNSEYMFACLTVCN